MNGSQKIYKENGIKKLTLLSLSVGNKIAAAPAIRASDS